MHFDGPQEQMAQELQRLKGSYVDVTARNAELYHKLEEHTKDTDEVREEGMARGRPPLVASLKLQDASLLLHGRWLSAAPLVLFESE